MLSHGLTLSFIRSVFSLQQQGLQGLHATSVPFVQHLAAVTDLRPPWPMNAIGPGQKLASIVRQEVLVTAGEERVRNELLPGGHLGLAEAFQAQEADPVFSEEFVEKVLEQGREHEKVHRWARGRYGHGNNL